MKIYQIDLNVQDTSTRNMLLVEAEAKYALSADYDSILDSTGELYAISTDNYKISLIAVKDEEDHDCDEEDRDYDEEEYTNEDRITDAITAITKILLNSLNSNDKITSEQAETMVRLAYLRNLLLED